MAFPQPRPQAPQLPQLLLRTVDCQQGAVRAVRFNGKSEGTICFLTLKQTSVYLKKVVHDGLLFLNFI